MGLREELEKLKDAPNEIIVDEKPKQPEPEDEVEGEQDDTPEQPAPKDEPEPKDDAPSGYQKRKVKEYEKRTQEAEEKANAAAAKAEALERRMAELEKARQPESEKKPAPQMRDRDLDPDGWAQDMLVKGHETAQQLQERLDRIERQRVQDEASNYLRSIENDYAKTKPDYHDVINHGIDREVARQKFLNPAVNEVVLRREIDAQRVQLAAQFQAQGKNPVEAMYNFMVQSYGQPESKQEDKDDKEGKNFDAVRKNKAKSATALSAGGRVASADGLSQESGKRMSVAEFSKLSAAEKDRIFNQRR